MTAVATTLAPFSLRTKAVRTGRRPARVAPRLHQHRDAALVGQIDGARSCTVATSAALANVPAMPARIQLTERGLAVVLGGFTCLALLTLAVLVNVFLSFSNAPLS